MLYNFQTQHEIFEIDLKWNNSSNIEKWVNPSFFTCIVLLLHLVDNFSSLAPHVFFQFYTINPFFRSFSGKRRERLSRKKGKSGTFPFLSLLQGFMFSWIIFIVQEKWFSWKPKVLLCVKTWKKLLIELYFLFINPVAYFLNFRNSNGNSLKKMKNPEDIVRLLNKRGAKDQWVKKSLGNIIFRGIELLGRLKPLWISQKWWKNDCRNFFFRFSCKFNNLNLKISPKVCSDDSFKFKDELIEKQFFAWVLLPKNNSK